MKEEILSRIDTPQALEKLYRENKAEFKKEFNLLYPEIREKTAAQTWHARLNFEQEESPQAGNGELSFVLIASLIAAFLIKLPEFIGIHNDFFYPRNIGFVVFPLLSAYFLWKQKIHLKKQLLVFLIFLLSAAYINLLPDNPQSDTLVLACIHLPLFLWTVLGFSFTGNHPRDNRKRLGFLRYNGDLVVMTTLILLAGGILTGLTIGLFSLIELPIEDFYFRYIVMGGLAASPLIGTYLVQTNPQLVGKVSPVIARIFTPIVLITLVIYLFAVLVTGKNPYTDREFLFIFNMLLIGVMALIFFSVAETSKSRHSRIRLLLLSGLSLVTVVVNGIALSAILFRISEGGITPNRLALLGGNLLILINLLQLTYRLFKASNNPEETENVEQSIAAFLPLYSLWAIVVTFLFPLVFGFK